MDISMDFIYGLQSSHGKTSIFVVVDHLTKYAHFCPISHPYTASTIAQFFMDNIVKLHGVPQSIVSDRDKIFTSGHDGFHGLSGGIIPLITLLQK